MSIASRITQMEQHIGNAYNKIEDLGIDLTDVDKNIDNIATMLEDVWDEYPKVTATDVESAMLEGTKAGRMEIDLKGQTSQSVLPTEYQQVQYIENTGSSYIDTGKILTQNNSFEFKMKSPEVLVSDTSMNCGSRSGASSNNISSNFQLNNLAVDFNNSNYSNYRATYSYMQPSTIYKVYSSKLVRKISDENDNVLASNTNVCNDTIRTPNTCTIFKINPAPQTYWLYARIKLYYFKIWENDELVINLVPCYRKADNEIGMYDTITNTFLTNQGTGIFVKGNDVPNPDYLQQIKNVTGNANEKIQNKNFSNLPANTSLPMESGNIQICELTKETAFSNITISLDFENAKFTTNGAAILNFKKQDGTNQYYTPVNFNLSANTTINGKYTLTVNNLTFKEIRAYLGSNYAAFTQGKITIQIEQGSTATPYVTHQEQNLPFTFSEGQRAMQGTQLLDDGIHNIRKQRVLDGTEFWNVTSRSNGYQFVTVNTLGKRGDNSKVEILSNYFKGIKFNDRDTQSESIYSYVGDNDIRILTNVATNVNDFKQWLSTHNVTVEFILAEEEIIPYNSTQQSQYNAIKQARSYDDITIISSESDELGFNMDVEILSNGVSSSNTRTLAEVSLNKGSLNNIKEVDTEDTEVAQDAEDETSVESEE